MFGEVREGFLEAKDLQIRQGAVRRGLNAKVTATRTLRKRGGSFYIGPTDAVDLIELRPVAGHVFGLLLCDGAFRIIDETGRSVFESPSAPWSSASGVWVEPYGSETLIGHEGGLHVLTYENGLWTFGDFEFDAAPGGELAQPYWAFERNITVQPSGRNGAITLTSAPFGIFKPGHVGVRGRYNGREVEITGYISPTQVSAVTVRELAPSYRITVESAANFLVGQVLIGQDTNFQGLCVAISGSEVDLVTIRFHDGPDVGEKLSSDRGDSTITAKSEIAPLASPLWDEQLISNLRGYPRAGASVGGRLALIDHPLVPDIVAMSSARSIRDFRVGSEDDDAIVRQTGDNTPRFLHLVNMGDLLLFSDRGCYYVPTRDNGAITPSNFVTVLFDKRAASPIKPVQMDDGVLFVEASGEGIAAALLDGNVYLKWSVRSISVFHEHLIRAPVKLCGPSLFSGAAEKYVFVINADGGMAVMSWYADFSMESVGFLPWTTAGAYKSLSPIFNGYWAITERPIGDQTIRMLERMDDSAILDCMMPNTTLSPFLVDGEPFLVDGEPFEVGTAFPVAFEGQELHAASGGWDYGQYLIGPGGANDAPVDANLGYSFPFRVMPWPVEQIESQRAGVFQARLVQGAVSVMHTHAFQVRANRTTKDFGGYTFGDITEDQPEMRTKVHKFLVLGRRDHPEIEIIADAPGQVEVLAITQEVTY